MKAQDRESGRTGRWASAQRSLRPGRARWIARPSVRLSVIEPAALKGRDAQATSAATAAVAEVVPEAIVGAASGEAASEVVVVAADASAESESGHELNEQAIA